MVDVSGIPNMGFGGGGYFGGIPNQQPAMSAAQINAGMWGNYSPGAAQATAAMAQPTPPGYGQVHLPYLSGSFGPAAAAGTYSPGSGLSSFSGTSLGGSGGGYQPTYGSYGGDSYGYMTDWGTPMSSGGYNAPRQYGWMPNEGAPAPAQPSFNDIWNSRGAQSLARDNLFNNYSGQYNPTPQPPQQSLMQQLYGRMGLPQPWTSPMSPNAGAGWGGFDSGMNIQGSRGSNFLSPGGGFSSSGADPWGGAWATGTPAGTRSAVPNVGSYMPSGQFGGENTNLFGMNMPNSSLGASGIRGSGGVGDTAALGGYPFGGYVPQDYRGIQGWPQAQGIAGSPLAGYGATPQSYINNNFGGMQQPVWSPGGIVMGDRLRGFSGDTLNQQDRQVPFSNPFGGGA